jgi:hypothetical protein
VYVARKSDFLVQENSLISMVKLPLAVCLDGSWLEQALSNLSCVP